MLKLRLPKAFTIWFLSLCFEKGKNLVERENFQLKKKKTKRPPLRLSQTSLYRDTQLCDQPVSKENILIKSFQR